MRLIINSSSMHIFTGEIGLRGPVGESGIKGTKGDQGDVTCSDER